MMKFNRQGGRFQHCQAIVDRAGRSYRKAIQSLSAAHMAVLVYFGIRIDPADIREAFRVSMIHGAWRRQRRQSEESRLDDVPLLWEHNPSHPSNVKFDFRQVDRESYFKRFYDTNLGIPYDGQSYAKLPQIMRSSYNIETEGTGNDEDQSNEEHGEN